MIDNKMEPLSSFAIKIALGITQNVLKKTQGGLENELKKAFEKALNKWSPNSSTRENFKEKLRSELHRNLLKPEAVVDLSSFAKNKFERDFFVEFEKAIAEYPSAFNYLKEVKDLERFKAEIEKLSNIQKEVEDINKKVDQLLENSLPLSNLLLEAEWKRQIGLYKEDIEQLKPKSSLKHLKALEESFKENDIQPSKSVLSYLEFLKAQCYELLGKSKEANQSFIKAKNLNHHPLEFREKACISYAVINQLNESLELAEEILKEEEHNSTAWAVKVILLTEPDLEKRFEIVPDIVKKDSSFQRIVYFKTISDGTIQNKFPAYYQNHFFRDVSKYSKTKLTSTNYKDQLFLIETTLQQWQSNIYFDFVSGSVRERNKVEKIHQILGDFIDQLTESEIEANKNMLGFYLNYIDFLLYGNPQSLKKMDALFKTLVNKYDLIGVMLANSFQLSGEIDKALQIINSYESKSFELYSLELFCLGKNGDVEGYSKISSEFLNSLGDISINNCDILITIIDTLSEFKKLEDHDFNNFFRNIQSNPPSLKTLASNFYRTLKNENPEDVFSELKSIENEVIREVSNLRFYLPYCYFLLKEYNSSIICFDQYLSQEYQSRDFYFYIITLLESNENHKKLLLALENWRNNCSFNGFFLKKEIELHQRLKNWNKCLELTDYYLQNSNDEWVLVVKIFSINELDLPNKGNLISENFEIIKKQGLVDFYHIQLVSSILIEIGEYQKALDFLYYFAKDPENIQARTAYFQIAISIPENFIKFPEVIEKDHYVKYLRDEKIEEIKIVDESLFAYSFLSKKINDEFSFQDPFSKEFNTIKILAISDKYHQLFSEILKQQKSSPYSGLPFQSFELPKNSPDDLKEKLIKLFGIYGSQTNEAINKGISEYYNYEISLTEVIIRSFNSNLFGGYFELSHKKMGIIQMPLSHYSNVDLPQKTKFVLDFSSLIILNQLSHKKDKIFLEKFIISNGLIQYIKSAMKKELAVPKGTLSANITLEKIEVQKIDKTIVNHNITFYRNLLEWVEKNCQIEIVESKLDLENAINLKEGENNILFQLFIENIALVNEDKNRVLISDDFLYFKIPSLGQGVIFSTEYYIKHRLNNSDELIYELVKNRYIGLSISKDLLLSEYGKKKKGESNFYLYCLTNCSLRISETLNSAKTVVDFLKELALNPLIDKEELYLESFSAFVLLLEKQIEPHILKSIKLFIEINFQLLGKKYDVVKNSFEDAIVIQRSR